MQSRFTPAGNLVITLSDLLNQDLIIQLGFSPVRIDIIKDITGVKFKNAYENKVEVKWGKLENVNFISIDDLIANKEQSGRAKDIEDINWIKQYSKKKKKL